MKMTPRAPSRASSSTSFVREVFLRFALRINSVNLGGLVEGLKAFVPGPRLGASMAYVVACDAP
jgi:hypothetical protein